MTARTRACQSRVQSRRRKQMRGTRRRGRLTLSLMSTLWQVWFDALHVLLDLGGCLWERDLLWREDRRRGAGEHGCGRGEWEVTAGARTDSDPYCDDFDGRARARARGRRCSVFALLRSVSSVTCRTASAVPSADDDARNHRREAGCRMAVVHARSTVVDVAERRGRLISSEREVGSECGRDVRIACSVSWVGMPV